MSRLEFTTPVGRMLMGSLYIAQDKDAEGKPLVIKSGPHAGQPKVQFFFAVGIPKNPGEQHWAQTPWGQSIWKAGHDAFNAVADSPHFAWKVVDGDSAIPNRMGKKPCDREGYPGHWVISFTSGFAPKVCNKDGSAYINEPDAVKLGYFVQVYGNVDGNGSQQQPGVFINFSTVSLQGYGPEIITGKDAKEMGFGNAPAPAGMSATPPAGMQTVAAGHAQTYQAGAPAVAYAPAMPNHQGMQMVAPPPPPPVPNTAFLAIPAAPPPVPAKRLTDKANGASYEQLIGNGWNDDLLVQHGLMVMS